MGASASMAAIPAPRRATEAIVLAAACATVVAHELAPARRRHRPGGPLPDAVLRRARPAGACGTHLPRGTAAAPNLASAIEAIGDRSARPAAHRLHGVVPEHARLVSRQFRQRRRARTLDLRRVVDGSLLGGTGLSNPMKSFFGIESMQLKGKVDGGYIVHGALPWVSNLGPDHIFGTIFERRGRAPRRVMFLADCAAEGVTLQPCAVPGDGRHRHLWVQFRDAFVPDALILADPVDAFVKKIRAGFILLQAGMGIGLIRDCIEIMEVAAAARPRQPFLPSSRATSRDAGVNRDRGDRAGGDPYDPTPATGARVVTLRLRAGDARRAPRMRRCSIAARAATLTSSRPAPAARSLFRRHRHAGHQAARKMLAEMSADDGRTRRRSLQQPQQERPP